MAPHWGVGVGERLIIRTSSLHNLQGPVQNENASPFVQNQEKSAIKGVKIL